MSGTGRVFVSYRREDTRHLAGRLADRLLEHFRVFMDMDTIEPGSDFTDVIKTAVEDCDVLMAVIGPQWTTIQNGQGIRRLDDPDDWVVAEIATALQRKVSVIPVLVDGAVMPTRAELPPALAPLASRQAMTIHHESFSSDVTRLITAIERRLGTVLVSPPDQRAVDQATELRRRQQLADWSAQADQAAANGRWSDVVVLLENIRAVDAGYPDLARRLQIAGQRAADQRRTLAELYDRAGQAEAAGNVPVAIAALRQIVDLDPANADAARRLAVLRGRHVPFPAAAPVTGLVGGPSQPPPGPPPLGPSPVGPGTPPRRKRSALPILIAVAAVLVVGLIITIAALNAGSPGAGTTPSASIPVSPSPVVDSASPSPSASPTPSPTPTGDTSELRTRIPTEIRNTCEDYAPPAGDALESQLVGAVRCTPGADDAPETVWYFQYPTTATSDAAYAAYVKGEFTKGDCTKARQRMTYTTTEQGKTRHGGTLHCYEADGDKTFAWTNDPLHIVTFAADPKLSYKTMKAWWEHAGPYRNP